MATMLAISTVQAQQRPTPRNAPPQPPQETQREIGALAPTSTRAGHIVQFTHAATGEVDGFVLDQGTTVHFPTYLSRRISEALGDARDVEVTGLLVHGTDRDAATILEAQTITERATRRTITVTGTQSAQPGSVTGPDGAAAGTAGSTGAGAGGSPAGGTR
jgi:hypothetical protein